MKKKYNIGGREIMGEEVDFEPDGGEKWNTYILADGTKLRMKAVVASVIRLDEYLPNGDPMYMVNASNVVATDVPDQLKKRA
ncbi:MAG: hypothetical protein DMG40_04435 [Acidobacteria bacterium]|nr:MAG: hypothetical protein DMG40_04435 [Acidobacteriota bacterium]